MVNFENGKVPANDTNLNKLQTDLMTEINKNMSFNVTGQLANPMYWRIGKLNRYFGSLITLNIFCDAGYVMTVHLNIGYVSGQGIVLEKIGTTSTYSTKPFTKVRLTYKGDDCYLELYNPQALTNVRCAITIHSTKNYMCDFTQMNEVGSVPEGYSTKEIEI